MSRETKGQLIVFGVISLIVLVSGYFQAPEVWWVPAIMALVFASWFKIIGNERLNFGQKWSYMVRNMFVIIFGIGLIYNLFEWIFNW